MNKMLTVKIAMSVMLIAVPLSGCGGSRQSDSKVLDKIEGKPVNPSPDQQSVDKNNVGGDSQQTPASASSATPNSQKTIDIMNAQGTAIGKATLTGQNDAVKIHVEAAGLAPGKHGIHLHAKGACDAPDFKTAGDHWNPEGRKHGADNAQGHLGDLSNIEAGQDGKVSADIVAPHISLAKTEHNTIFDGDGTALVIHEKEDDGKTDPSGNSGNRIACGVLK
jgi:Cu-Zn family superoxide dismutase